MVKKNDFPKKYIFKAFATVAFVVLEVGRGCVTLPLSAWGATSLSPKCPLPLARGPGLTRPSQGAGLRLGDPVLVAALQCREGALGGRGAGDGRVLSPFPPPSWLCAPPLTRLHIYGEGSWASPVGSGSVARTPWNWRGIR